MNLTFDPTADGFLNQEDTVTVTSGITILPTTQLETAFTFSADPVLNFFSGYTQFFTNGVNGFQNGDLVQFLNFDDPNYNNKQFTVLKNVNIDPSNPTLAESTFFIDNIPLPLPNCYLLII